MIESAITKMSMINTIKKWLVDKPKHVRDGIMHAVKLMDLVEHGAEVMMNDRKIVAFRGDIVVHMYADGFVYAIPDSDNVAIYAQYVTPGKITIMDYAGTRLRVGSQSIKNLSTKITLREVNNSEKPTLMLTYGGTICPFQCLANDIKIVKYMLAMTKKYYPGSIL
jgi:hypothetical protein